METDKIVGLSADARDRDRVFDFATRSHALVLIRKMVLMTVDVLGVCIAAGVHKLLEVVTEWALPEGYCEIRQCLHVSFAAAFALIYFRQVYDMVHIFIPSLFGKIKKEAAGVNMSDDKSNKGGRK